MTLMFLAQLCLLPLLCRSQHPCSGKGAGGGGCCSSPGVVGAQRKRMLDLLGPAQLFEVTSGWWPAVSTCRSLFVAGRCVIQQPQWTLVLWTEPPALLASLLSCGARDLCHPPGGSCSKPPSVAVLGNPDGNPEVCSEHFP